MTVYTRKILYPVEHDVLVAKGYFISDATGWTQKIPIPGRGRIVHVEAHCTVVMAATAGTWTIQNDAGDTLGTISTGVSDAVGTETEWVKSSTTGQQYEIDNGHVRVVLSASGPATGEVTIYVVVEPMHTCAP
jgi:hypothetical protein